ncbi:hypothetical protein [Paludibaculum fermentans]|uniref:hypothetical protein n=1 Tax=Paludibaculum fermentans TaxID=1473598 RepID=UPI003EB73334
MKTSRIRTMHASARWLALLSFAMLAFSATAAGQSNPLQCDAIPDLARTLGQTEISARAAGIIIVCWGGTPTPAGQPVPTNDILIYFNADYSGRTTGQLTESLLTVDEPSPQIQVPCTTDPSLCGWTGGSKGPNVFQGRLLAKNAIAFYGVPVNPPGDSGALLVLRVFNVRLNVSTLPVASPPNLPYAVASVAMSGSGLLDGTQVSLGTVQSSMLATLQNAAGDAAVTSPKGVEFTDCAPVTKRRLANLRFSEQFGTAFLQPNWTYDPVTGVPGTPAVQAVPGGVYNTTSGFYNPNFPATNNLNKAGLADSGTRLQATFSGLPPGATLYVSTVAVTYTNGVPAPNANGLDEARLTASTGGAFAPVAATETLDGIPVAVLPVDKASVTAVWEILKSHPGESASLDFPVWISFSGSGAGLTTATVAMQLGPTSSETGASDTAHLPRFADSPITLPLLTAPAMCPSAPYLVTTSPPFLPVVVDGQTYTSPMTFSWQPGSTHTLSASYANVTGPGTRQVFTAWSDSNLFVRTIVAPPGTATYTANYKTQYQVNATVTPAGCGTVKLNPAGSNSYYDAGQGLDITATPVGPCYFVDISGDGTSTAPLLRVFVTKPMNFTASFVATTGGTKPVSVSPASGSGSKQYFISLFQAAQGASTLRWVQMLVAKSPDGGGQPFCLIHYDAPGNSYWVYSDIYGFFQGPAYPRDPTDTLQSSACALDTYNTSAFYNGAQLTLRLMVLFKSAAADNIYLRTMDFFGADSGWVKNGTWTMAAMPPPAMSVSPSSGGSASPYFQANYALDEYGQQGGPSRGWQQFLVAADPTGGGQPFCYVHLDRAANMLWMYSSDIGFFLGPVAPGAASTKLDSSACSVNTAAASTGTGFNFSSDLKLPLTLKAPMSGAKKLYMRTMDELMRDSGWQQVGTYQVP